MSVSIELVDQASIRLEKLTEEIRGRLRVTMARDAKDLASLVRSNISGPILHVKTGALLASIRDELYETPDAIWARVYSDDKKAAILEWGGHTKPHMIYPVTARALHFIARDGTEVYASKVSHPGSLIPEFGYMRTSLAQLKDRIISDMLEAVAA